MSVEREKTSVPGEKVTGGEGAPAGSFDHSEERGTDLAALTFTLDGVLEMSQSY